MVGSKKERKKIIGCSLCNEKFSHGLEYREHWLKEHLEFALKYAKEYDKDT
jgi:hypothetical protein